MTVITRFAPSPTGFLHIGGARTALFNWLYARHHGGKFLLRIEDTDLKRSTQEAIDAILAGMEWLGLEPDAPPVFQSGRAARHAEVAFELLSRGKAFKCYVTPEELAERRENAQTILAKVKAGEGSAEELEKLKAEANALMAAFRSPYRDGLAAPYAEAPYVIRLRAPDEGRIELVDDVQGEVSINAKEIDDLILLRADGTPTYMLAVVVDDHDMGVTQVIRGDDHLTNTFRQIPIFQGMGWDTPKYAHIPLIHGPDGAKLSKRHGALGVEAYRNMGYIPEGLKNYLLRLGWSHGDDEFIPTEKAIEWFELSGINKGASRMDFEKLAFINGEHLHRLADDAALALLFEDLEKEQTLSDAIKSRITAAISVLKTRGQTIPEISSASQFLIVERPIDINSKARKKLKPQALEILGDLRNALNDEETWTSDQLETLIQQFCETRELSLGQVGPQLRTALTGNLPAPDLHLILFWLGKAESIGRIDDVLKLMNTNI